MTRLPLFVPILAGALLGALATIVPVGDSDLFWHLATGRETLERGLPRTDAFSWTIPGRPVFVDQWLGDAALAAAYALGEWRGLIALRAVAVFAVVALTVGAAVAAAPRRPLLAILASLPAIALSRFAWTDRPELLGLALFAGLLVLLRDGRDRTLLFAVPVLLVWANVHGSYALGLALTVGVCAERALAEPPRRAALAAIAVAAAAATLVTPSGLATWTSAGAHFYAPPRYVSEEGVLDLRTLPGLLFAVTLALVMATAFLQRPASLRQAVILVPVAFVSLTAARHAPFLAIAAAPFIAAHAAGAVDRLSPQPGPAPRMALANALGAGAAAVLLLWSAIGAPGAPDERAYPRAALASLPPGAGLLNDYDWGGWLIWSAPRTPVFIDGRLFPYVPDVLDDYRAILGLHADWQERLATRGVRTMLLRPASAVAVRAQELGWRVIASSDDFILLADR